MHVFILPKGPPSQPKMQHGMKFRAGKPSDVNCTSDNNYPAPTIEWFLGSQNITRNSTLYMDTTEAWSVYAKSHLSFVPTQDHHRKILTCYAVSTVNRKWKRNDSIVLDVQCKCQTNFTHKQIKRQAHYTYYT